MRHHCSIETRLLRVLTLLYLCVCSWLTKNKKFSGDARAFKRKLDFIWFGLYKRQAHNDSSGFEHVFIGEERDVRVRIYTCSIIRVDTD